MNLHKSVRPPNTIKALDTKQEEYMQCCDKVWSHDPYRYNLNSEKAYQFMYHQAFWKKKPRGGNKKTLYSGDYFDHDVYKTTVPSGENPTWADIPKVDNPVGVSTFQQCKACLRAIYKDQTVRRVISIHWEGIWTEAFEDLEKHVKERVPQAKRASYQEKASGEFAPYAVAERFDEIEEALWLSSFSPSNRSVNTTLRHRYALLHSTTGILWCESLCRAELSDFLGLRVPKKDKDVHPMFIMINQIEVGKTTHGRTQCGRVTRHKNVNLCSVGALSFYLQYRFYNTREFHDFNVDDWLDNRKWFDVKLLADLVGEAREAMGNDSYSDKIKAILKALGLPCGDLLHLGRKLGSKLLDLLEEENREIKRMGQWSDGIWEGSYSSKLPFGPMRKLAGYSSSNDFYYNTRTTIDPDEALLYATPIGEWVYQALVDVGEVVVETGKHGTAMQVLRFLQSSTRCFYKMLQL